MNFAKSLAIEKFSDGTLLDSQCMVDLLFVAKNCDVRYSDTISKLFFSFGIMIEAKVSNHFTSEIYDKLSSVLKIFWEIRYTKQDRGMLFQGLAAIFENKKTSIKVNCDKLIESAVRDVGERDYRNFTMILSALAGFWGISDKAKSKEEGLHRAIVSILKKFNTRKMSIQCSERVVLAIIKLKEIVLSFNRDEKDLLIDCLQTIDFDMNTSNMRLRLLGKLVKLSKLLASPRFNHIVWKGIKELRNDPFDVADRQKLDTISYISYFIRENSVPENDYLYRDTKKALFSIDERKLQTDADGIDVGNYSSAMKNLFLTVEDEGVRQQYFPENQKNN